MTAVSFYAHPDDSGWGTSSQHRSVAFQAAMPPFVGAFFLRAAALRHRTLRNVSFAACRHVGQAGSLRATQRVPRQPAHRPALGAPA